MLITSPNNAKIKELAALKNADEILSQRLFLLEGERLVDDFLSRIENKSPFSLKCLVARSDKAQKYRQADYIVSDAAFNKLSDTASPQGVLAVVAFKSQEVRPPKSNYLILDRVSDPGNMGTILRSSAACGFNDIYFVGGVCPFIGKVVRATMGAFFHLNFFFINESEASRLFSNSCLLSADMDGKNIFEYQNNEAICGIIVGNEARGVSVTLNNIAKAKVSLPMKNIESLNAAVAASVLMYQIAYGKKD